MAGILYFAASETIRSRCNDRKLSGTVIRAPPGSAPRFAMAVWISVALCTVATIGSTLNSAAESMNEGMKKDSAPGTDSGLYMSATRVAFDVRSRNNDKYFPVMVACRMVKPVMLPPGWAMLEAKPLPIGSETDTKTIGIDDVAFFSAATT